MKKIMKTSVREIVNAVKRLAHCERCWNFKKNSPAYKGDRYYDSTDELGFCEHELATLREKGIVFKKTRKAMPYEVAELVRKE